MVIDCHTHWTPPAEAGADRHDPVPWLAPLREQGIEAAIVLPTHGLLDDGRIEQDHDDMQRVAARASGAMIPFCTCAAWFRDEAVRTVERCLSGRGFRGIKFHPWLQGVSVFAPAMDAVCELAAQHAVPILLHDGTPPYSLPAQIGLLARRHRRTTFVLGHCGLLEYWREAAVVMGAAENIWGCICSPHAAAIRYLVQQCDTNRLMWGSDYGFGPPGSLAYRLQMMHRLRLGDDTLSKLLEGNPRRLLGM